VIFALLCGQEFASLRVHPWFSPLRLLDSNKKSFKKRIFLLRGHGHRLNPCDTGAVTAAVMQRPAGRRSFHGNPSVLASAVRGVSQGCRRWPRDTPDFMAKLAFRVFRVFRGLSRYAPDFVASLDASSLIQPNPA
jgi:hypothetical protein